MSVEASLRAIQDRMLEAVPSGGGILSQRFRTNIGGDGQLGISTTASATRWLCGASLYVENWRAGSLRMGGKMGADWHVHGILKPVPGDMYLRSMFEEHGSGDISTKPPDDARPPRGLAQAWEACMAEGMRIWDAEGPGRDW